MNLMVLIVLTLDDPNPCIKRDILTFHDGVMKILS